MSVKKVKFERHEKSWGHEVWHHNEEFCLKTLIIEPGCSFSMHFHVDKEEIFIVERGRGTLEYIDTENAKKHTLELTQGDMFLVERLTPHRVSACESGQLIIREASTHHEDSDSYRVQPGESHNEGKT